MTLEELLALLPDNTAGEISAADLRTVVTELFNTGAGLRTDVDANATGITNLGHDLTAVDTAQQQTAAGLAQTNSNMDALFQQVQGIQGQVTPAIGQLPTAGKWNYNSAVNGPPVTGEIAFDNQFWDSASTIFIASTDANGVIWSTFLMQQVHTGSKLWMQGWDTPGNNANMSVTGPPVSHGSYIEIPIGTSARGSGQPLTKIGLTVEVN